MKKIFNKKVFFKIHSWFGIKLSILFFIVCFSGTMAVISHELDWIFNPAIRAEPSKKIASRNKALANLKEKYPEGKILYWSRSREPYLTDIIQMRLPDDFKYVFLNPYTAEVQGDANVSFQRFFRDFHYFLFIPFQVGNYIVLFFGFVLFISFVTSLVIHKNWYKKLFELKLGRGKRVFYSSFHKLIGAWSIPFMFLISITGIWYFVERSDFPKISHHLKVELPKVDTTDVVLPEKLSSFNYDLDKCIELAEQAIPNLDVKAFFLPSKKDRPIYMTGTSDVPLVRHRANRIYIDPYRYKVLKVQKAENINTITWINDIADPFHFGYWGGITTKIIWFIFGMTITILTVTGPWLYWKRNLNISKEKKRREN